MSIIGDVIDSARKTFGFKDAIFYKENSDLQDRYEPFRIDNLMEQKDKMLQDNYIKNPLLLEKLKKMEKWFQNKIQIKCKFFQE